jgi:hypothetical protein
MTDKSGSTTRPQLGVRAETSPKGFAAMISKGNLLRLVVSLTAFASLASLGGGYFDGH